MTMADETTTRAGHGGRIKDARGRPVTRYDPVRTYLLNEGSFIPAETLEAMAEELLPGVKRKRLVQIASLLAGVLLVVGGNLVYFRWFSSWKGLDPVNTTIYIVQAIVLVSGPVIAFRMARTEYSNLIVATMLKYRRCLHCGYDLRLLPVDAVDGATVCPECGCAWRLADTGPVNETRGRGERAST
jgi:hypothetical protein